MIQVVRISCAECHQFVDLPDQTEILGRFACADCRRERHRAGSVQSPPVRVARTAHRVSTALAERRARRSSRPPPPVSPGTAHTPEPATAAVVPPIVPPPADVAAASAAAPADLASAPCARPEIAPAPGGSSTPGWVLPEEALAPPPRRQPSRSRLAAAASLCVIAAVAGAAALVRPDPSPEPAAGSTEAPPAVAAARPAAATTAAAVVVESDRSTRIQDELTRLASQADRCRKPGDPAGVARIRITFSPSGRARPPTLERGAFSAPKDRVGTCLASLFQTAKVEPFSGPPVTVTKSVVVR